MPARAAYAGGPKSLALRVYASDQAHSSVEKAAITLGIGERNVRRVPSDATYRMSVSALRSAIDEGLARRTAADGSRRHRRHNFDDERRPGGRDRRAMSTSTGYGCMLMRRTAARWLCLPEGRHVMNGVEAR